ncbi:hypothetical protein OBBRIDRAFT_753065 [Obba rivulosa]|uniref:Uncharacterized protein n=1 Tax=Obba rivulosa TaxID=1052685 RepID=A0A8E2DKI2_9APHY|nr:hypothetical protein OBBRIDRAFT_753065 [Obba rivulosa]
MSSSDRAQTKSRFLSTGSGSGPRRSPSRQSLSINGRRSPSARGSNLGQSLDDDSGSGRHSLAHELAVALMPEPSSGSKLLAAELGIEYDEGAEGIDQASTEEPNAIEHNGQAHPEDLAPSSFQLPDEHVDSPYLMDAPPDAGLDPDFDVPAPSPRKGHRQPLKDPMIVLSDDLEYTEQFLTRLRRLDTEHDRAAQPPRLEQLASDVIRRINDAAREREGQLRELLEYEREFRRIAGEVNGMDVLGRLDILEDLAESDEQEGESPLDTIQEESLANTSLASEWDVDGDGDAEGERVRLGDEEDEFESMYSGMPTPQATRTSFIVPPVPRGPPTPAYTAVQLGQLRSSTSAAARALASLSEHTQVNAAATTEAGRKIRALKNKLGGWRGEWDSAERSRVRVERWEAGLESEGASGSTTPTRTAAAKRINGKQVVQEHLRAFEEALAEANIKTQAIIAAVAVH